MTEPCQYPGCLQSLCWSKAQCCPEQVNAADRARAAISTPAQPAQGERQAAGDVPFGFRVHPDLTGITGDERQSATPSQAQGSEPVRQAREVVPGIEARLRGLMRVVNSYEKATGIGGSYAEDIQRHCNSLLNLVGSRIKFGAGLENPVDAPQQAQGSESGEADLAMIMSRNEWRAALLGLCQGKEPAGPEAAAKNVRIRLRRAANDQRDAARPADLDDSTVRTAFRRYDERDSARGKSPWQIWRDAVAYAQFAIDAAIESDRAAMAQPKPGAAE